MKVSIIIPVLNEALNLQRTANRLRKLLEQGHEVIIVDGGSADNTKLVAHKITGIVINSKPGRSKQMNCGAAAAEGDILLFLHADTLLPDNAIQLVIENSHRQAYWGRFDARLSGTLFIFRIIESMMNLRSRVTSIATGDQAIFIDKNLFNRIGGFAEIELMEDIEICKRLKKIARPKNFKEQVVTSSRRWESRGIVSTVLLMWKLRLLYFFGVSPKKLNQLYR